MLLAFVISYDHAHIDRMGGPERDVSVRWAQRYQPLLAAIVERRVVVAVMTLARKLADSKVARVAVYHFTSLTKWPRPETRSDDVLL
jgi:hypothetical protein